MNRWLKNDTKSEIHDELTRVFKPADLKVFDKLPEGRINETIHEVFIKPASVELPGNPAVAKEWWAGRKPELMAALREKVFGGWAKAPPPLKPTVAADVTRDGVRLRAIDFVSETGVELRMWVMTSPKVETPAEVILTVLHDAGWDRWCADLGPEFADALQLAAKVKRDDAKFAQNRSAMETRKWAFAAVAPRGIGPTRWADPGSRDDIMVRRRFPLLGQTLDGQRVWDVRRAITATRTLADLNSAPLSLQGEGEAAGVALYAALFEPSVAALDLWHLPPSHHRAPALLNVLKYLDTPQALALAFPRKVTLHVRTPADRNTWDWPARLDRMTGGDHLTVKVVGE
jgi:hypothetical protein